MKSIPRDLVENHTYCVNYLVYLNENDQREHAYVAVRSDNMPAFQEAVTHGGFDPEDYGVVLEEGEGDASFFTKERMRMLYKCDPSSTLKVADFDSASV